MKAYTKVVFVKKGTARALPRSVYKALYSAGNTMPMLVFMSPDGKKNYGAFSHKVLRGKGYSKLFKEVKKTIKVDQEEGLLKDAGLEAEEANKKKGKKKGKGKNKEKDATEEAEAVKEAQPVVILNPRMRTWKSAKGKEIKAKLIKYEDETYHLQTAKGKSIKVKADYLDPETVEMAEEILNINRK